MGKNHESSKKITDPYLYSDDIFFLQSAKEALIDHPHPLRKGGSFYIASLCRILAVIMITNIEDYLLLLRKDRDKYGVLNKYFKEYPPGKRSPNGERVRALYKFFQEAGIEVDREVFEDYLAIKYLRNMIVHARYQTPDEEVQIREREFPTDVRQLSDEHWSRMLSVNYRMVNYITATGLELFRDIASEIGKFDIFKEEKLVLIHKDDIPRIFWNNLEIISSYLSKKVQQTVVTKEYDWSNEESMKLFYLAARRAGQDGLFKHYQNLCKEALDSWKEFWQLTFEHFGISVSDLESTAKTLLDLHERGIYPKDDFLWHRDMPKDIAKKLVQSTLDNFAPLTEEQIISALNIGDTVYDFTRNITAVYLFVIQLPIIDPENTETYLQEGEKALLAKEVSRYWKTYLDDRAKPKFEKLVFYRKMTNEFRS